LIQEGLPRGKTIENADKGELTNAICRAVKRHRSATVRMTSAAATAQPELAAEITATVLRCLGGANCDSVAKIVSAACKVKGTSNNAIADAAIARAPDCAEAIDRAARPAKKESAQAVAKTETTPSPTPKPTPEETFDPHEPLRLVCDSGSQRAVRAGEVDEFLRTHPDAVLGTCPPVPSPFPGATLAPATLVPPP
jgi:hypothetical protein